MTRLLRFAAVAGVLAFAAGCGGSTVTGGEPLSLSELSQAAATSADAPSGRYAFSFDASLPGDETFSLSGEGAFDAAAKRARFSFDLASFAKLLGGLFGDFPQSGGPDFDDPSAWQLEAIQDGEVAYMRFPALDSELPAGKSWVRMDEAADVNAQGFDLGQFKQFGSDDRRKLLDFLRAASGEVETVGTETLRGVETTHYRATVDPADYEEAGSFLDGALSDARAVGGPVDVWLDEHGFVRKLEMSFEAREPGATEASTASMRFELWDYGEDVEVELPTAADVVDAAALD